MALNAAHQQWLGYSLADFADEAQWFERVYADEGERTVLMRHWYEHLDTYRSGEPVVSPELTLRCKDGSRRIARGTMTADYEVELVAVIGKGGKHIAEADAGRVLASPFDQAQLNRTLADMLADNERRAFWGRNGLAFADCADLYSMPQKAADVILAEKRP